MLYDSFDFDLMLDDFELNDSGTTTSEDFSLPDLDNVDDQSEETTIITKPKKKRIRVRKPLPVAPGPKVIKNDIRRSYSNMFINVLNSCDIHLMYGMLDTFFVPNFLSSFRKSINGEAHAEHGLDVRGLDVAAQHWFSCMALVPDLVVQLGDTNIEYHTGKITSSINMTATRLHEDSLTLMNTGEVVAEVLNEMKVDDERQNKRQKQKVLSSASESEIAVNRIQASVDKVVNGLVLRKDPQIFNATGKIILYTDNDKRITKMEWYADTSYSESC